MRRRISAATNGSSAYARSTLTRSGTKMAPATKRRPTAVPRRRRVTAESGLQFVYHDRHSAMDLGLKNKIAMVGGASKGLGYAVARALAAEGAAVSMASRDGDAIRRAADTVARDTGGRAFAVAADLSAGDAIAQWHAATVKEFGGVDLLFANTGGPPAGTALGFDDATWQAAFDLLLMSVIRTVRLVVPSMRARGGGAILIGTSSSVKEPVPYLALSNVLRSGVTSLAKTLSVELAADKIRVNRSEERRVG